MQRAVLLVSHGTIDDLDDLPEFVRGIRRGSPPSPELLKELRSHYDAIGGRSPLNGISAQLARKTEERLGVAVAWANRLWKPYVRDVLARLVGEGARQVAIVPLAQHSAHVYVEDAQRAAEGLDVRLTCASNWGKSSTLNEAFAARIVAAHEMDSDAAKATVLMTAHSLPREAVARGDPYEALVRAAAERIATLVRARVRAPIDHAVAFQSQGFGARGRDGKPIEWLGPDLRTTLDELAARGEKRVVFAPIGFLADHVEILYDLDIEARAMAESRGLTYVRAASLNADDDLIDALVEVARPLLADG
jgi:protoporphyrin/coproporphyrin ferrochelatase